MCDRGPDVEERHARIGENQKRRAREVREMLWAIGAFDRTARVFVLVNALESHGVSFELEANELRVSVERLRSENDTLKADGERLVHALSMARGFLGMAIRRPESAAFVADEALEAHAALASESREG